MAKTFKAAIIGCGGIANGKHMPALSRMDNVAMVAFCDLIPERAQKALEEYGAEGAKVYATYEELLANADVDVVHVCTPNKSHAPISIAAMEAGKDVLCEKPMAKTASDAVKMVEAAKRTGRTLSIGYQSRYREDSQYLKKCCEAGDLGEIYYARAHAIRRRAVPTWGVFLNEEEQGGGPLIDIGTHALDLTLWEMNDYAVESVMGSVYRKLADTKDAANAWGSWKPEEFTVEDSAFGFIKMKSGATIMLEASWALNTLDVDEAKTSLCGTKAGADMREGLRLNGERFSKLYVTKPEMSASGAAFFDGEAGLEAHDIEARQFYAAIENGTKPCVLPEQALVVTQILEAIYTSAKTGKPVFFD